MLTTTTLDMATLLRYPHLRVPSMGTVTGVFRDALARLQLERRVACELPNVLLAPMLLQTTDLIALLPKSLVTRFDPLIPLVSREPPLELDGVWTELVWHARSDNEPAHSWIRDKIHGVCSTFD